MAEPDTTGSAATPQAAGKFTSVAQNFAAGAAIGFVWCLAMGILEYASLYVTEYSLFIFAFFLWTGIATAGISQFARFKFLELDNPATFLTMTSVMAVGGWIVLDYAHGMALRRATVAAQPVVVALNTYRSEHGKSTWGLRKLVPEYMQEIPSPVYDACRYFYEQGNELDSTASEPDSGSTQQSPAGWQLSIQCPAGWLFSTDYLVYRPDGAYEGLHAGFTTRRRVGQWMHYYYLD